MHTIFTRKLSCFTFHRATHPIIFIFVILVTIALTLLTGIGTHTALAMRPHQPIQL